MHVSVRYLDALLNAITYQCVHPKRSELSMPYQTHRCKQMLESCRQDTKESMSDIDKKYGLIKFTNIYYI